MRKVVVTEFMTLDGVMEDPGGAEDFAHGGWSFKFSDPEGMRFKLHEVMDFDALLLGRVTYEGFAEAWPERRDDVGFADKMNAMKKYVVSSTLGEVTWQNSEVVARDGDVVAAVAELKRGEGGDILVAGSRSLVRLLAQHDLVDEYRLMVHPIVLGSGKQLFDGIETPFTLKLTDSQVLATGSLILTYEPVRD
ncbi:MAG TPA: dihydrofolate reductase family protein [Conexibacter sp.]|jgi:dihydrofolate reductase|nr:dihydrofolate reductase family protein [Conexibacter sp.]